MKLKDRLLNILVAIDQLVWCVCTLGAGYPDETISAAAYRMELQHKRFGKIVRPVIDWLFIFFSGQKQHCFKSWVAEIQRTHLPLGYRQSGRLYRG